MSIKLYSRLSLLLGILAVVNIQGCKDDGYSIAVPICTCVLRGTLMSTENFTQAKVTSIVEELVTNASEVVWYPGAGITFLELLNENGDIPVIDDTDVFAGQKGDVVWNPQGISEGTEIAGRCREAWGRSSIPDALVLVITRSIINSDGSSTGLTGFVEQDRKLIERNQGADLCRLPRNLTRDDMKGKFILLEDPKPYIEPNFYKKYYWSTVLAHEMGHILMLGHGDGLDNDSDHLRQPLNSGPRLFDEYCDPVEYQKERFVGTDNVMTEKSGYSKAVTDLQRELARTVASLMPGAQGPN